MVDNILHPRQSNDYGHARMIFNVDDQICRLNGRIDRLIPPAAIGLLFLFGCTMAQPSRTSSEPDRIQVLEFPTSATDQSLQRVLHAGRDERDKQSLALDHLRIADALEGAAVALLGRCVVRLDGAVGTIGAPIDADTLAATQAANPADMYLRLQVTDYGETPRQWRGAYLGFEVATTAGIAAGLAFQSRAVAGAYLLEESAEELSEGYAGFWMLNRLSRPVRISADLVDGRTGQVIWRGARTGLARWQWAHLMHRDDQARDELLAISTGNATAAVTTAVRRSNNHFECASSQ
jgi:hypothetical protein